MLHIKVLMRNYNAKPIFNAMNAVSFWSIHLCIMRLMSFNSIWWLSSRNMFFFSVLLLHFLNQAFASLIWQVKITDFKSWKIGIPDFLGAFPPVFRESVRCEIWWWSELFYKWTSQSRVMFDDSDMNKMLAMKWWWLYLHFSALRNDLLRTLTKEINKTFIRHHFNMLYW